MIRGDSRGGGGDRAMTEETAARIQRIVEQQRSKELARQEALRKTHVEAAALARRKADAPSKWDQAWQDLVSAVKKINEQLKPLSLQVLLSPCTRADDNLAVFEIRLDERNERSNYSMLCTVSSIGTLYLTRHLPGLTDSKSIGSMALTKEAIDDLILRFIENALGNRSRIEMHDDYAGHGQARRVA